MPADIKNTSTQPDTTIVRQGHTTNGAFGSDPAVRVKGGRPTRDITIPTAKG